MNETQLTWLKDNCNKIPLLDLCKIINQYNIDITILPLSEERVVAIEQRAMDAMWTEITNSPDTNAKIDLCRKFVAKYRNSAHAKQYVEEAQRTITQEAERLESADWAMLNKSDYESLCQYRRRYPESIHSIEIENLAWNVTIKDEQPLKNYIKDFPNSRFVAEANELLQAISQWNMVRNSSNISIIEEYIAGNPHSPYRDEAMKMLWQLVRIRADIFSVHDFVTRYPGVVHEAQSLYDGLKAGELQLMKNTPSSYDVDKVGKFLNYGIFTDQDLIRAGVASQHSLELIRNRPQLPGLSMGNQGMPDSVPEGTDIFFLGIPASGKTCTLMGLFGSRKIRFNHIFAGGPYIDRLEHYRNSGQVPGSTPGNFMTFVQANIPDGDRHTHPVNIVEMAGERFALDIVLNPNAVMGFEHLADGATEFMMNSNRKAMFIFVDPSVNGLIKYKDTFIDQRQIIARLVDILATSESVLKKVDSIHFIMTKADMIGDRSVRDSVALERFKKLYESEIEILSELMKKYGINANTKHRPKLYTFSLGNFYIGDVYDYDATDADKLVETIKGSTVGVKKDGAFVAVKKMFNRG